MAMLSITSVGMLLVCACGLVALVIPVGRSRPVPEPPGPERPAGPDPGFGVFFVTANLWLIAGLVLLLGGESMFGYRRVEPAVYWVAVWGAFATAAVCARRWRSSGESL